MSGVYCPASFAVIGARLVMGDHQDPVWLLWRLPARIGLCGTFAVMGVVITQIYLNRRLRAQHATPVLGGGMYLVATLFPIIVGFTCTKETPRPGGAPTPDPRPWQSRQPVCGPAAADGVTRTRAAARRAGIGSTSRGRGLPTGLGEESVEQCPAARTLQDRINDSEHSQGNRRLQSEPVD